MMQQSRIEGLGAAVGGTDVGDHDMVMELRFKVPGRQKSLRRGPNTIGLLRATATTNGYRVILEIGDGGVRSRVERGFDRTTLNR